ncbi:ATP synthase subunit I [Thiobacillus sp.]
MCSGTFTGIRQVVRAQTMLLPVAALIGVTVAGAEAGLAAAYGVLVALAVSAVLAWREQQSIRHPEWNQHRLLKMFMRVGVERLVILVALLGLGLVVLKLEPFPLLLGLGLAQFAWIVVATGRGDR